MKINIIGDGSFGTFLKQELPNYGFELTKQSEVDASVLAVPLSSYDKVAGHLTEYNPRISLINVCSVQKPSTDILLKYTHKITSIHPLFGARTPKDKRHSILTYAYNDSNNLDEDSAQNDFLQLWEKFSQIHYKLNGKMLTPEKHDIIMAKTHVAAIMAAKQAKVWVDRAANIPDELIPNSFRLLRDFVKTLDDMPAGTVSSIMSNPYI